MSTSNDRASSGAKCTDVQDALTQEASAIRDVYAQFVANVEVSLNHYNALRVWAEQVRIENEKIPL